VRKGLKFLISGSLLSAKAKTSRIMSSVGYGLASTEAASIIVAIFGSSKMRVPSSRARNLIHGSHKRRVIFAAHDFLRRAPHPASLFISLARATK